MRTPGIGNWMAGRDWISYFLWQRRLCVWMCDCNDFVLVLFMSFFGIILYFFVLPLCVITVMRAQLLSRQQMQNNNWKKKQRAKKQKKMKRKRFKLNSSQTGRSIHSPVSVAVKVLIPILGQKSSPIKKVEAELTFPITENRDSRTENPNRRIGESGNTRIDEAELQNRELQFCWAMAMHYEIK